MAGDDPSVPVVVNLDSLELEGRSGAIWSLPHGGDLDANLVHLQPNGAIQPHVNHEVDVVISVIAGDGHLILGGASHELENHVLALIPKGTRREIHAGGVGMTYLSIHRQRNALGITAKPRAGQ